MPTDHFLDRHDWVANEDATETLFNGLPSGLLDYQILTSNISTDSNAVNAFFKRLTLAEPRILKITVDGWTQIQLNTDVMTANISGGGSQLLNVLHWTAASAEDRLPFCRSVLYLGSAAGTFDFTLSFARVSGTGLVSLTADPTSPCTWMIEDLRPYFS